MASGVQQSSESAMAKGILALEMARDGVRRCRQDVQDTRGKLSASYQGSDGREFGNLLDKWDAQCAIILRSLQEMIDRLYDSLEAHGVTQEAAVEAVAQAKARAEAAFAQLMPA
ncbi:hypothetical protein ACIPSE_13540 [Streptomyces sp. NPDC090106]|uniref:hypothetical protein n=1 Tax=Streptomyces sp. NPDC090106 TaxID=3365946 RepID=UPI003807009F